MSHHNAAVVGATGAGVATGAVLVLLSMAVLLRQQTRLACMERSQLVLVSLV